MRLVTCHIEDDTRRFAFRSFIMNHLRNEIKSRQGKLSESFVSQSYTANTIALFHLFCKSEISNISANYSVNKTIDLNIIIQS